MDASMLAGGSVRRLQYLFGGLLFSFLMAQAAQAAPVVVSVDHRVAVSYSKPQLDARKGSYSVQVRITNKSAAPLLSPLRLSFDKAALGSLAIGNAQGTGADGRPYFDIKLSKEMLVPKASTDPVSIEVVAERGRAVARIEQKFPFKTLETAHHVSAGVEEAPLEPRAEPYALKANSGKNNVRFGVRMVGQVKSVGAVYLRRVGSKDVVAMNDNGKDGDLVAKDGIYGANVSLDTNKLKPDTCLGFFASLKRGRMEVTSSLLNLCVSAFPIRLSDSKGAKTIDLLEGTKAIADELLISVDPGTKSDVINRLAAEINAEVVGSIPPLNFYQLKLKSPVESERLLALVARMREQVEVKSVSVNALGSYAYIPTDSEFPVQHGLQRVRAHDVWDISAIGLGETITVLDSGLDRTHPDFGVSGDCQLSTDATPGVANSDCGGTNNDAVGHGTQVAGVLGAKTNNALGVAGVAYGAKLHSIRVSADAVVTLAEMTQGFTDTAAYGASSVVNASFSGGPWALVDVTALCSAMNSVVLSGVTPVAQIVNAAGNDGLNGYFYPAKCNDSSRPQHSGLTRKDLLSTVANSASIVDIACGSVALDLRCSTSNFGSWVDIAAPGSVIRSTAVGGGYTSGTGTSLSAPIVAGAAAILKSCGVPLDQIENTLRTSANVTVSFPDGSSAPRLDIYRAMMQRNQVPSGVSLTPSSVNENTPTPLEVGTLSAIDADTCDKHTFTIVPGGDGASFNIVGNKLNFNAGVVLDREAKASYTVTVHAVDFFGASPAADTVLTVTVNDVNEFAVGAVSDTDPAVNSVVENATGAVGLTAHATDADATNNTITYSLTNDAGGRFAINANSGGVTAVGAIDREAAPSYGITVRATSSDGSFSDQPFTINIIDANEFAVGPVSDSNAIMDSVAENSPAGTTVGVTAHAVDADATTSTVTYTLTDDAGGRFAINPSTGVVTVSGVLDYETATSYSITVQATSSDGSTSSASFSIAVSNVNEAPVANGDTLSATQDTPATYPNTAMLGNDTDVDAGTTLTIQSVTNGTYGTVVLNGDNSVTFTPAAGYSGAATFSYIATDGALSSNSATVTVNVAAVNHAPVANNDTLAATEDTPVTYPAASLLGNDTDVDAGTTLTIASVLSGAGGTASLNGDGTVSFTPNANFNGAANFTYTVTDGALTSPSATVMVNVAAVNDSPTGFPIINGTRTVGQTLTADTSGIADNDGLGAFHYQWLADGLPVGTDSSSFLLTASEVGKFMKVQVSYTDGGGTLETIDSVLDAVAIGDPHITTVDGLHYDFQSAGEFVALRGRKGMEVQLRMSPVPNATPLTDPNSGLLSAVSVNTGLAAKVGAHRVTYQAENGNGPVLRVDGAVAVPPPGGIDLGDGGRVSSLGSGIQIDFPDQTALIANASMWSYYNTWWLQISVFHTSASEGVMGARSKGSWLPTLSDGSALGPMPALMHDRYVDLYVKFADSWRVTEKSSLFDYAEGTSTATYTDKSWPAENVQPVVHNLVFVMPTARKVALKACQDVLGKNEKADCVFDVMAMGQVEAAKGHLQNQKVRLGATEVLLRAVDRPTLKGKVVYTATVKRLAMVKQERTLAAAPAGAVQFLLDGLPVGKPVTLDAKGQATLSLSRFKMGQRNVTARFIPAKGTLFLPSINRQAARAIKPTAPVLVRGIR